MKKWIYVVLVLSIAGIGGFSVHAASSAHEKHLNVSRMNVDDEFKDTDGTFILHDLQKEQTFVYNRKRANQRQTPQSTFKVVNALIGLQVKAVRDEYDVKRWDGVKREFESWNRDHTLGSAMRESAIWYYQALARDIGEERRKHGFILYLTATRISARESTSFGCKARSQYLRWNKKLFCRNWLTRSFLLTSR